MAERKVIAGWVTVGLCLISLGLLITSFVFAILARQQVNAFKDSYSNIIDSWEQDMVFTISRSETPSMLATHPDYYLSKWGSNWPGNINGCYCTSSDSEKGVSPGLYSSGCSQNQTKAGCSDIDSKPPQFMSKWFNSEVIYAVRGKRTSYLENFRKIDSNGNCQSGYMHCGNKNSLSKGICIPTHFSSCPLTDIRTAPSPDYQSLPLSPSFLYFASTSEANSISELLLVEHTACFLRSHFGRTPGRRVYPLKRGNHEDCSPDSKPLYLHEIGEKTLLKLNDVDYSHLPEFETSDNYKYKLTAARYLDWSVECADTVQAMDDKRSELDGLSKDFQLLFILYIISFVLSVITILVKGRAFYYEQIRLYKLLVFARICLWAMIMPSCFICMVRSKQFSDFFVNISALGCSDRDTNQQFDKLGQDLSNKLTTKNYIYLIMSIGGMFVEVCMTVLDLCFLGTGTPFPGVTREIPSAPTPGVAIQEGTPGAISMGALNKGVLGAWKPDPVQPQPQQQNGGAAKKKGKGKKNQKEGEADPLMPPQMPLFTNNQPNQQLPGQFALPPNWQSAQPQFPVGQVPQNPLPPM